MSDGGRVPCPLCGGGRLQEAFEVTRYAEPFTMCRCQGCGLLHRNPRPATEDLDRYYGAEYYAGDADFGYGDEREHQATVRVRAAGRLERAGALLADAGIATRRVVELGSAFGIFLDEARARGWEVQGCEVSQESGGWAATELGIRVHACDLADAPIPDGSVDLVTGSELIEHLADPLRTLRAAHRVLVPGGLAVFSTANERSVARLLRGAGWGYFMPGHVVVWNPATAARLFRDAGFERLGVTAGDERGLASYREFLAAGGPGSVAGWLLRRLRVGGWTLGAGMVLSARKAGAP